MGIFFDRYRQGEHKQVWDELFQLGEAIYNNEALHADALAVTDETMQRVRHNIELLIPLLQNLGYRFGDFGDTESLPHWFWDNSFHPYIPSTKETSQFLNQITGAIGSIPLSLERFYLEVGGVNFMGQHPVWDKLTYNSSQHQQKNITRLDPILLDPLNEDNTSFFLEEFYAYEESPDAWPTQQFRLELSPDSHHKYGVSGGASYEVIAPSKNIDGYLLNEWHNTTFVDYLRICLRSGGLPGLELLEEHKEVKEVLSLFRENILDF